MVDRDDRMDDQGIGRRRSDRGDGQGWLGRRELLLRALSATLGLGAVGLGCDAAQRGSESGSTSRAGSSANESARVRGYRVLGNTGLRVSDVGFGTGGGADPALLRHALDRGITYFDTAESYPLGHRGQAEKVIGETLRGERNRIVLTSKTEAQASDTRQVLMRRLHGSLRRLQTDHVDIYLNHAVNDRRRLENPEWFEFVELAKRQGKIRFAGMSGHAGRLIECLDFALDGDLVDVILVAFNFGGDPSFYEKLDLGFDIVALQPELPRVLAKAKQKGVGVLAMKTLRGGRLNDLRAYERPGGTFAQAALRWVLSHENVDALVISMDERDRIEEYLGASGATALQAGDLRLLRDYTRRNDERYCRPACDACTGSCPYGVPISDVLRARMYAEDYGDLQRARGAYAELGVGASPCLECSGEPCRGACPHGLDIAALTRSTLDSLARA